jgi:hypothetical protein
MERTLLVAVVVALASCKSADGTSKASATPPPAASSAAAEAADAATAAAVPPGTIGKDGGAVRAEGASLVIPPDALKDSRVFTITRVAGEGLVPREWPRGTLVGFVFDPPDLVFRVPATIELPHGEGEGEVACQNAAGDRTTLEFENTPAATPYPIHVVQLPKRCAVYSPDHVKALKQARAGERAVIDKANQSFKWEIKGKICDPHEMVRPNAGKDLHEPPGAGGCPAGMAPIKDHKACVDRWEAHLVELLDDKTVHTYSPFFNPGTLRVKAVSAPGAIPQAYISQIQAGTACANAGKRLCRDDEWIAACRGAKNTQFPYGNDEKRGTCNDHRDPHPAVQYLEAHDLSVFTKLEHPCINQIPDSLFPTGSKKECSTPEGVYDIVGNLHEWTADPTGHFRGGYYVDTWLNGHGCDYVTTRHEPHYWDYSTGFRCCADKR